MSTPLDILATCDDASISATARIVRLAFALGVDNFVAAKAPNFNKVLQSSTSEQQRVQQELLRNNKKPETSTRLGIWFGTRGSEVQILSPRPYCSNTYGPCQVSAQEANRGNPYEHWAMSSRMTAGDIDKNVFRRE